MCSLGTCQADKHITPWSCSELCSHSLAASSTALHPTMQFPCKHKLQLEEHLLRHGRFVIYCRQILQYLQGTTQLKDQATDMSEEQTKSSLTSSFRICGNYSFQMDQHLSIVLQDHFSLTSTSVCPLERLIHKKTMLEFFNPPK